MKDWEVGELNIQDTFIGREDIFRPIKSPRLRWICRVDIMNEEKIWNRVMSSIIIGVRRKFVVEEDLVATRRGGTFEKMEGKSEKEIIGDVLWIRPRSKSGCSAK